MCGVSCDEVAAQFSYLRATSIGTATFSGEQWGFKTPLQRIKQEPRPPIAHAHGLGRSGDRAVFRQQAQQLHLAAADHVFAHKHFGPKSRFRMAGVIAGLVFGPAHVVFRIVCAAGRLVADIRYAKLGITETRIALMAAFKSLACVLALLTFSDPAAAAGQRILVQSTTSTENSGLYDHLVPLFEAQTGWDVDVIAVGTGQAIRNAEAGDADVLLVHARASEEAFVAAGYGIERFDLMYNDFVIIGPASDPAGIRDMTLDEALSALAQGTAPFISRGDDSGTHKKEISLWGGNAPAGNWYRESGSGMGATIRVAIESSGYTLTDRATWVAFGAKGEHEILLAGDAALFNQYGIIAVNPKTHPHVNAKGAQALIDWLLSPTGQKAIAAFRIAGQQLFYPNAK